MRVAQAFVLLGAMLAWGAIGVTCPHGFAQGSKDDWAAALQKELPPPFLRLVDEGSVQFVQDDSILARAGKSALTIFRIDIRFKLQYRLQPQGADRYRVTMALLNPSFRVQHEMVLPSNLDLNSPFGKKLIAHEFDHVAISSDPRLERLAAKVLWTSESWMVSNGTNGSLNDAQIQAECESKMQIRRKSIEDLVTQHYAMLDRVSNQGLQDIDDRKEFFSGLYSEETLTQISFEFLPKIRTLIKSSKFQETKSHYERLDAR